MKKLLAIYLALMMIVMSAVPGFAEEVQKSDDIVILYTNDVHTYIDGEIGYALLAGLKSELLTQYENVLLVDAGDHIQGTAYGSMDQGETVVKLMNAAGYDLATLGNHEFDYGMEGRIRVTDQWAEYTYISCNFYEEENGIRGENVLDSYRLFHCGEEVVAFVGITTPETITKSTPTYFQNEHGEYIYGISGGADGTALYEDVQLAIDAAEAAGATKVIALGHLGVDPSSCPWTSQEVIAHTTGLDVFIDGHSHTYLEGAYIQDAGAGQVLLTQTGQYLEYIGMMIIDAQTGDVTTQLLSVEDLTVGEDPAVKALQDSWIDALNTQLGQSIGTVSVTLDNFDSNGNRLVRKQETNSGDFTADAIYYLFDQMELDVDVAINNGGSIRNESVTGDITYLTCKNMQPFGNVACLQIVSGQQLLDALEWGSRLAGTEEECGSFLHVSGLVYSVDTSIPSTVQSDANDVWIGGPTGEYRVHSVMIYNRDRNAWEDLDPDASYHLAGYNYTIRDLGGGYAMFEDAENVLDYVMEDYMVVANYVQGFENNTVGAANSPLLKKYPNLKLDYSDVNGCGRITISGRTGTSVDGKYTALTYRMADDGTVVADGRVTLRVWIAADGTPASGTVAVAWPDSADTAVVPLNDKGEASVEFFGVPEFCLDGGTVVYTPHDPETFLSAEGSLNLSLQEDAYRVEIVTELPVWINGVKARDLTLLAGTEVSVEIGSLCLFALTFDQKTAVMPDDLTVCGRTVHFTMPAGNVRMKIDRVPPANREDACYLENFADLDPGAWYHEAVDFVLEQELMQGVGNGKFDPYGSASRAMLVTVLWRLEGEPWTRGELFSDVAADAWYSQAVSWAAAAGIVEGMGDGRFAPMDAISREQLATMLWRYAAYKKMDLSTVDTAMLAYYDISAVSQWACEPMRWCCSVGIINGKNGALVPQGEALRVEMAQMLMKFCKWTDK